MRGWGVAQVPLATTAKERSRQLRQARLQRDALRAKLAGASAHSTPAPLYICSAFLSLLFAVWNARNLCVRYHSMESDYTRARVL
eukprot:COSAG05_NODE_124_length_17559_cov_8.898643_7_plen_85_part_00